MVKWYNRIVWLLVILSFLVATGVGIVFGVKPEVFSGTYKQVQAISKTSNQTVHAKADNADVKAKAPDITYQNDEGLAAATKPSPTYQGYLRGYLYMPAIAGLSAQISLPIYEGVSSQTLAIGAGVGAANRVMGQDSYPVFAHNMGDYNSWNPSFFSPMETMNSSVIGHYVYTNDGGHLYTWQIDGFDNNMANTDQHVLENTGPRLYMVTCKEDATWWRQYLSTGNAYAAKRIMISAKLVDTQELTTKVAQEKGLPTKQVSVTRSPSGQKVVKVNPMTKNLGWLIQYWPWVLAAYVGTLVLLVVIGQILKKITR